jgi:iron complex transport system ATP-binding protein
MVRAMMLEGRSLAIGYRDRLVGSGLDVGLRTGEVLALLGPNVPGVTDVEVVVAVIEDRRAAFSVAVGGHGATSLPLASCRPRSGA